MVLKFILPIFLIIRYAIKLALYLVTIFIFLSFLRIIVPNYERELQFFEEKEVRQRMHLEKAKNFLSQFDWSVIKEKPAYDISIIIIASNRTGNYLTIVVSKLLMLLKSSTKISPKIAICNVNVGKRFPELYTFEEKLPILDINQFIHYDVASINSRIKKESMDYWKCLNESRRFRSNFVLLLEDDALPIESFFEMMHSLLSQLERRLYIDYVKLYHPRKLRKIPSVFQTIGFVLLISGGVHYYCRRNFLTFSIFICTYLLIRLVFIDLPSDFRFFITKEAYLSMTESCCTPAVLFRSNQVPQIVSELYQVPTSVARAKDHILDESQFIGRATDINIVVHIGEFSSIRNKNVYIELNDSNFIDRVFYYVKNFIFH